LCYNVQLISNNRGYGMIYYVGKYKRFYLTGS